MLYQIRPDSPRIREGKVIKYEMPAGSRMALDVHPFGLPKLADPTVPLWVTEGIKKGDCLVSRGCCAIALLGVWNWRGTNDYGGKTALADWEFIALHGRQVYICLVRLRGFLETRGCEIH